MLHPWPGFEVVGLMVWRWSLLMVLILLVTFAPLGPDLTAGAADAFLRLLAAVLYLFLALMMWVMVRLHRDLKVPMDRWGLPFLAALTLHCVGEAAYGADQIGEGSPVGLARAISLAAPVATLLLAWHAFAVRDRSRRARAGRSVPWSEWEREIQERLRA
jgi:hypothetical protein